MFQPFREGVLLALDSGAKDGGITAATRELDRILTLYGIAHSVEIYDPGDHISHVDERVEKHVLPFFSRHLESAAGQPGPPRIPHNPPNFMPSRCPSFSSLLELSLARTYSGNMPDGEEVPG